MLSCNFPPTNWTFNDDMALRKKAPEKLRCDAYLRSKSEFYLDNNEFEKSVSPDEIDNPKQLQSASDRSLFEIMKHEINRLNSFTGKWPLSYVKPAHLAENGFFYLQSEDKVQCAFCHVIIDDWNVGQKPLKEHIKKSPRCKFLLSSKVGNVPMNQSVELVSKVCTVGKDSQLNSLTYKPKHPRMADIKKRLMTYKDWPLIMLNSQQLAECGLYYTGVADVVTCFFCGGSLGNWELHDDPWAEHTKFFPNCAYLSLIRKHGGYQRPPTPKSSNVSQSIKPSPASEQMVSANTLTNEIIRQASNIFSKALVQRVVLLHLRESSRHFSSLNELCEAILEYNEKQNTPSTASYDVTGHTNTDVVCKNPDDFPETNTVTITPEPLTQNTKEVKDALLCKICMDREMGVVFQPCGHLVSCPKCAQVIFNCPLCRTPVTHKVRTYLS